MEQGEEDLVHLEIQSVAVSKKEESELGKSRKADRLLQTISGDKFGKKASKDGTGQKEKQQNRTAQDFNAFDCASSS